MLNVTNVFKQLDAIRKHNPKCKYINLSSAAVYGNPQYLPINEAHPLAPISPYGNHKKMAEDVCKEFYVNFGVSTCSLRIFSAYGPGLQKQLFWDLHTKSLNKAKVKLYGTGNESRDFIYVSEVVKAIDLVIQKADFKDTIVNVANGEELTIRNVVTEFYNAINANIEVTFGGEERKGDPINWVADISKLKNMGYKNAVSIEAGLKNYSKWLNENA
jgi:dTDP-glucose 4,6-dehydratase/UDP-glucose 4-epimerase